MTTMTKTQQWHRCGAANCRGDHRKLSGFAYLDSLAEWKARSGRPAIFVCERCGTRVEGGAGSEQWCYCARPPVRMTPEIW